MDKAAADVGYQICGKCKVHFLYNDDSHDFCMRCRGYGHTCELCSEMGTMSKSRVKDWESKYPAGVPPPPKPPVPVTFDDLATFKSDLKSDFRSMFSDMFSLHGNMAAAGADHPATVIQSSANCPATVSHPPVSTQAHPNLAVEEAEILLCPTDRDSDGDSMRSSWDHKRGPETASVAQSEAHSEAGDSVEGLPLSQTASDSYVDALTRIIHALQISDAVTTTKTPNRIVSSRGTTKRAGAFLPFDADHRDIVDKIWNGDPGAIPLYRLSAKSRYKIVDKDFGAYLQPARIVDEYLVQELEQAQIKVQVKTPKLPNPELASVDRRAAYIEQQSLLGMSCNVSQSWMLQYLTQQLTQLDSYCRHNLASDQYTDLAANCDLASMSEVCVLAQDATLDSLDLHARQAAEAKWVRRSLWVDQTRWAPSIKTAVKRFPTIGDGTLCGPPLKAKLESYRLTSKALAATASLAAPRKQSGGPLKRRAESSGGPPPKRQSTVADKLPPYKSWKTAPKGRGFSSQRGGAKGQFKSPGMGPGPSSG